MRPTYVNSILDIVRKDLPYGFVREADANKIQEIVECHVRESVLLEKEINYNKGFIDGARSAHGILGVN
jgi:hypothetical protein